MARKREKNISEPNKTLELKKHVAVIHSGNKLSLLQRKIANALLFNAYQDLLSKDEHEIHIATLCRLIGYDSNDHKTIKKSLVNLLSTVLEWNLVDGEKLNEEGVWNASSIIADASIDGSICTYSYSNKMRNLLHRPNVYGRIDMLIQARFQSTYGLALYENCNRFQDIGKSPWFDLAKFRKLMGVEVGKYLIFRDFKTRVLDKAVEEVNKYSPIKVEPQLRKVSRRVVAVQFLIKKSNAEKNFLPVRNENLPLAEVLKKQFGFTVKQVTMVFGLYADDYIRDKVSLITHSPSFKAGKIVNLTKYLLSALKDDYQPALTNKKVKHGTIAKEDSVDFDSERQREQEQMLKYRYYQDKCLMNIYHALSVREKDKILKAFEKHMHTSARGVYIDVYLREGLSNPLVQDQFCLFLRQTRNDLLSQIPTPHEWMSVQALA